MYNEWTLLPSRIMQRQINAFTSINIGYQLLAFFSTSILMQKKRFSNIILINKYSCNYICFTKSKDEGRWSMAIIHTWIFLIAWCEQFRLSQFFQMMECLVRWAVIMGEFLLTENHSMRDFLQKRGGLCVYRRWRNSWLGLLE